MATIKLDVVWRFGRFQVRAYPATVPAPEFDAARSFATMQDALTALDDDLKGLSYDEDSDTLVFRNVAYADLAALKRVVRDSRY